ncbi:MAG: O-antigen ligase family protein [Candidatus Sericytochromatia bacterium]|nr:O-antigen ligase family protein [Candidatus Sericytochromatia bacterium]
MAELHPLAWLLLGIWGSLGLLFLLGSFWFCVVLMVLTLFTGILTAVPVGFTLKGPQFFALLGLGAWSIAQLRRSQGPVFPWAWLWPFGLFILSILPSFLTLGGPDTLHEATLSLRLLLNYLWLQLFLLVLWLAAHSLQRIRQLLLLGFVSGALSLLFGYGQQVAFYLGYYDPLQFVGRHSSIVDFYGPFLRLAPGTFANEYGEILQTLGLLLIGWLYLLPPERTRWRGVLLVFFWALVLGLVLNFTRASWLVFTVGTFVLLSMSGLSWRRLLGVYLSGGVLLALLLYVSQWVLQASLLLQLGRRFQELGRIQTASAGSRLQTWQLAWDAFLQSPWVGQGWGQYVETHNVPLQLLAETGVLGFVGFYGLMAWCSWRMFSAWRQAPTQDWRGLQLSLLMAFWGCLAFDLTNHGIAHFVLWYVLGLGLATAWQISDSE